MSKRKNNITYVKPQDPSFLREIKQQIGYNDGPSIETKRQKFEDCDDSHSDNEEEKPLVVVVKKGDLTAEEADTEQRRLEEEEKVRPANLNEKIIFKPRAKISNDSTVSTSDSGKDSCAPKPNKSKGKEKTVKIKLSFADEDEEENE